MMRAVAAIRKAAADQRGVVAGFFVRTILAFTILGIALYESGQIMLTAIHAHGVAGTAAQAAANAYYNTKSQPEAAQAARRAARADDPSAHVVSVKISSDGMAAVVEVTETAHTLVVGRISFTKKLAVVHATEQEAHSSF